MNRPDQRDQRIQELETRLARLSEASLRISESLDFDTVLQDVVDSAKALTASRYSAITVLDEGGGMSEFFVSGLTAEEHQGLWDMPDGLRLFEYFSGLSTPLRVTDMHSHLRALDLPGFVSTLNITSLLVAPIRHQGAGVGTLYLAHDTDDCKFSQKDEETLVMFASQAALVIANVRRHRQERQTRVDLESLIEASPVGVVVYNARTGETVSHNREAMRIVDSLRDPGQTLQDFRKVLTFKRGDGPEASMRDVPLREALSAGETVRAEEIMLRSPDGRTVNVMINVTPVLSEEGVVESVIITLQDLADVKELERMRAEFLAMVSHELRVPLTSIKGSAATALASAADLDPAIAHQFFRIISDQADHMHSLVSDLLDVARIETGTLSVNTEPAELAALVDRARGTFISTEDGNQLEIDLHPELPLVMADRRRIVQVLANLLTNAARNSPEASVIRVTAVRTDVFVAVSVSDEGRGIPAENLPHLFRKFSRLQSEEQGGDTGLGLAVCKGIVEAHGGRIWAESDGPDLGARFTFTLPMVNGGERATNGITSPASQRTSLGNQRDFAERLRILVVDDDPQTLRYVRDTLIQTGYKPIITGDPQEAIHLMEEERPHLALLDLMLPGTDGIELMQGILATADVPVIFLSAYGRDEYIARAFEMGATDYVVKPFSPTELAARIKSALRRREVSEPLKPYVLGDLTVDYSTRQVTLADRPVPLTAMEYRMLAELSAAAGRVLTYDHLLDRVWGEKSDGNMSPMRTIVGKLRRKLGDDGSNPTYIFTESRVGYRMPKGDTPDESPPANP